MIKISITMFFVVLVVNLFIYEIAKRVTFKFLERFDKCVVCGKQIEGTIFNVNGKKHCKECAEQKAGVKL